MTSNIYLVLAKPGEYAIPHNLTYQYEGSEENREYAEADAIRKLIGCEMLEFVNFPGEPSIVCVADEEAKLKRDPPPTSADRLMIVGAFVIVGQVRSREGMITLRSLDQKWAKRVATELNKGMPPQPLTDGTSRM